MKLLKIQTIMPPKDLTKYLQKQLGKQGPTSLMKGGVFKDLPTFP